METQHRKQKLLFIEELKITPNNDTMNKRKKQKAESKNFKNRIWCYQRCHCFQHAPSMTTQAYI